jgi:hypothetical protein
MLDPAEKKEIIDGIRHEFRTFKKDAFQPIADAVKANTDTNSIQRAEIAVNTGDISTLKDGVKENRGSIGRLFLWIIGVLVTILGSFFGMWIFGG